ncbi:MAG TPA: 5-oxoprolinase/urea amidolyase family protein [Glaciibacter sp.]|nr:5-oxoprolinase/urea amidolyase family protein [Glaciibacter sp.]
MSAEIPTRSVRVRSVRAVGPHAIVARLDSTDAILALQRVLLEAPLSGQVDVIAAAETVTVLAEGAAAARRIHAWLSEVEIHPTASQVGALVVLDTLYDGEDLGEVAELTGLSAEAVVTAHSTQTWRVAFAGFAPGFGYLVGENQRLTVPRRAESRTAVPAGAVGLAGEYSAVYPRPSPGGWQLIGRTTQQMWNLEWERPALLSPGDRVQFRPVRELVEVSDAAAEVVSATPVIRGIRVISPGVQSLFQDLGRPGNARWGVGASGAADVGSLRRGNRIVGNRPIAASIEVAYGGLVVESLGDQVFAVTGAPLPLTVASPTRRDWHPDMATPFPLRDGETLTLHTPERGVRTYLAVRGGFEADVVLGSRATDSLSGLGPAPVSPGALYAVADDIDSGVVGWPEIQPDFPGIGVTELGVVPGPGVEWFGDNGLARLVGQDWQVTAQSNRVGVRLQGEPVERVRSNELPSEGVVTGSIQVPPAGLPVLFLADHPITGGYPVIAVVIPEHLDRAAQIPIGGRIRFRLKKVDAES